MPGARRAGRDRASSDGGSPRGAAVRRVKARKPSADNQTGPRSGGFELAELRRLIELVQTTGIGELEVTTGGRTVRIAAQSRVAQAAAVSAAVPVAPAVPAAAPSGAAATGGGADQVAVTSPMVGTFYLSPAPDADPYVEVGDMIAVGQTVCIVEAMKLMNEIESEVKGRVIKILVENAQPVEYGQKLFLVEP
jgi:acetyl-CoA carboxylase biotin carboxyl carrier protein